MVSILHGDTQGGGGVLVPGAAVEIAATGFRGAATPLLEEERDPLLDATVADLDDSALLHRSGVRSRFTADNHPVDVCQIQRRQRAE